MADLFGFPMRMKKEDEKNDVDVKLGDFSSYISVVVKVGGKRFYGLLADLPEFFRKKIMREL